MSNGTIVHQALQLDRAILLLEARLNDYLKTAETAPTYSNVLRYVKTVAETGGRISIIAFTTETYLKYEDALFETAQGLRNTGFEVQLTSRLLSVQIPIRKI